MRKATRWVLLGAATLAVSGCGADSDGPWQECDTRRWPEGYPKPAAGVKCTELSVPLDWREPSGAQIKLRVARHASTAYPTGKAVFQLAGGPGGSSVAQSGIIPRYFPELLDTFDMIYVDQRGTGGSGYLDCSGGYPLTREEWEACGQEHADEPLEHYMTLDAAHDLEAVRQQLGYDKIYIRGGSYGTRLGLEYLRQFEEHCAAAVLDGLAPPDFDLAVMSIGDLELGITWLVDECAASPECVTVAPNLAQDLAVRRQQLAASPRPITIDGTAYEEDEEFYLEALAAALDWSELRYRVPRAIHEAVLGDNTLWNRVLSDAIGATVKDAATRQREVKRTRRGAALPTALARPECLGVSYVAPGLYAAITCAEWVPNTTREAAQAFAEQLTWGDATFLEYMDACSAWSVAPLAAELRRGVVSGAKTLLLSGEFDTVTPPEEGERTLQGLTSARHLVVPFATHSTMGVPCVSDIITQFFLTDGDLDSLDTSCLAQIEQPPW